jgi:hypothetical protein
MLKKLFAVGEYIQAHHKEWMRIFSTTDKEISLGKYSSTEKNWFSEHNMKSNSVGGEL